MEWWFMGTPSILLVLCTLGTQHVTQHQPLPYMDEIFHIPQVQKYCNASFSEWDPKITTLPGLYLFSTGLLKPLSLMLNGGDLLDWCSVLYLRSINSLFMAGNFYLFYSITHLLHRSRSQEERELYAVIKSVGLSLMPLLFFFNFLYYTDPGALFFVLYAYYYHLRGEFALSAILGMISMIFRQTNIVWVFFMALCNVCKNIHRQSKNQKERLTAWTLVTQASVLIINTIINCWSYAIVGLTAIAFVLWNGSVVVGDKSAHEACFNPPQLGYFACFSLGFSVWFLVSKEKFRNFGLFFWNYKFVMLSVVAASLALVYCYTHVHEYLLADNRHYTFYVWSKLFGRYWFAKYLLVPVYVYVYWSLNDSLSHMNWMIRISLGVCLCAALIPQKLMEFRYFVVPYIIIRLHMKNESIKSLLFELMLYVCINLFTFYIFLYKPIFWHRVHEPQRIMW